MPVTPDPARRARTVTGRMLRRSGMRRRTPSLPATPIEVRPDEPTGPLPDGLFVNPIGEGADPCVVRDGDRYLWCQSEGNVGVAIWESDRLTSLGEKHVVWWAPEQGPHSQQVWAPELVRLDGRWHIYVAASDGGNETHLAYVLVADGDDPLGSYSLHGPLNTGDGDGGTADNAWAIDMTVLDHAGCRYAVWSGWPDAATQVQHLYIAAMDSPVSLAGPRVRLFTPFDYPWERIRDRSGAVGINEAPQALVHGDRTFVVYSCGSALLPSYKLGMLELIGSDPLDPTAWRKAPEPIFESTERTFGVGHGGFLLSPDGTEWWHVYHAKIARQKSFRRVLHTQPMAWTREGMPELGRPVAAGTVLTEPSGTPHPTRSEPARWAFTSGTDDLADFDYYGHHQYYCLRADGLHLGEVPVHPVNEFRSGEKLVLRDGVYGDLTVSATLRLLDGARAVGLLFRVTGASVGYDAQRGYFAGLVPARGRLVVGAMDGRSWVELASAAVDVDAAEAHTLRVDAVGSRISLRLGLDRPAMVEVDDDTYPHGSVGLRVVDTHAVFSEFTVAPHA